MIEKNYGTFITRKQGKSVVIDIPRDSGISAGMKFVATGLSGSYVSYKVVHPKLKMNRFKNADRAKYDFAQDTIDLGYNPDNVLPVGKEL